MFCMNIAYLYLGRLSVGSGVHKKIVMQIKQWKKQGHTVKIYHASIDHINTFKDDPVDTTFEYISNILFYRVDFYDKVKEFADIIYMRYSFICFDVWRLMRVIPTIIEINSNEEREYKLESHRNVKAKIKYYWNYFNRLAIDSVAKGKVCVTYELSRREKQKNSKVPVIVIPNAIIENFHLRERREHDIPVLVFIGSPNQEWHGVDKIIKLAKLTVDRLNYIIIGADLEGVPLPSNVQSYGILSKSEYTQFLAKADVGVGTLALHRKGMNEACPLKIREYLSWGLPIIIGYEDTAFIGEDDCEWILKLPNCENNVLDNIELIKKFAYKAKDMCVTEAMCKNMMSLELEKKRLKFFRGLNSE